MASKFDEHYKLAYAHEIIQQYEKAAIQAACIDFNRSAATVPMANSVTAMEMALDSAEGILKGEGYFSFMALEEESGDKSSEDVANIDSTVSRGEREMQWAGDDGNFIERHVGALSADDRIHIHQNSHTDSAGDNSACDEEAGLWESMGDPEKDWSGWEWDDTEPVKWNSAENLADSLNKWLGPMAEGQSEDVLKAKQYMQECFSCFMNFEFNWQFPPLNLMAEIEKLLKILEELLDWIMERFKKSKEFIIDFLCNFDWLFDLLCPMDWIALMAMLSALLKKWMMDGFGLMLDWTGIVGPVIKVILDSIAGLLEALVALILQPIDCIIGVLKTADALVKGAMDFINTASDFWNHLLGTPEFIGAIFTGGGSGSTFSVEMGSTHGMIVPQFGKIFDGLWADLSSNPVKPPPPRDDRESIFSWKGPASGFSLAGHREMSEATEKGIFKKKDFTYISMLILGLQEVKNWIRRLAQNIIMALKALSMLFSGQLKLNIMKSGLIMMVIDLIAFIKALIDTDWDTACDEQGKEEQMLDVLNDMESESEYTVETVPMGLTAEKELVERDKLTGNIVSRTPVNTCTLDDNNELVLGWDNHFDVVAEYNDLRALKWGI